MASPTQRSQPRLNPPLFPEQTTEFVPKSSEEQPLSSQIWPEWAAAFPQTEAEILASIWPARTP